MEGNFRHLGLIMCARAEQLKVSEVSRATSQDNEALWVQMQVSPQDAVLQVESMQQNTAPSSLFVDGCDSHTSW